MVPLSSLMEISHWEVSRSSVSLARRASRLEPSASAPPDCRQESMRPHWRYSKPSGTLNSCSLKLGSLALSPLDFFRMPKIAFHISGLRHALKISIIRMLGLFWWNSAGDVWEQKGSYVKESWAHNICSHIGVATYPAESKTENKCQGLTDRMIPWSNLTSSNHGTLELKVCSTYHASDSNIYKYKRRDL